MSKLVLKTGPYMYPMSVVIAGANMKDTPNYTTVAFTGIIHYSPPMIAVSLDKSSYINIGIKEQQAFSVNIPSTSLLNIVNYFGTVSGRNFDKSMKVNTFYSGSKTVPMIEECPVNLECKLIKILSFEESNEIFIGEVINIYSKKEFLTNGKPDIKKIDPVLLTLDTMRYWKVGKSIGEPERIYE